MGYAELIAGGIAKPEDVAPFAGKIRTEAQRLLALIEDIIHLSRLDEGGETVAFEPVELSALCDTCLLYTSRWISPSTGHAFAFWLFRPTRSL